MVERVQGSTVERLPKTRESSRDFLHLIPMIVVAVVFVGVWEIIFRLGVVQPSSLFPSPGAVAQTLYGLWKDQSLLRAISRTLAFLMVHFATFGKGIQPYVLGLQTFPSIAWVPLAIIWFGFSEAALLFVTIIGSLFSVTVSFADALRTVPPVYLKAARNMGSDGMDLILRVTVPAALPHLISAMKVGWSFAWRSLIGAEVIFASVGLGFLLNQGFEDIAEVMGMMIVILAIGVLVDRVLFSRTHEWASRRRGLMPSR
jgi:NitT/TauT family transport system permease protein